MPYEEGQTPLDEDEKEGLLNPSVATKQELNELEQRNIEEAIRWTIQRRKRFTVKEVLTEVFVRELHRRMLGRTWAWAGSFRNTNKNIGADKNQIGTHLRMLLDDCRYWIEDHIYSEDEIAIRFKHRIVCIHCFANGNGRHSRLMADIMIEKVLEKEIFTWGAGTAFVRPGGLRSRYLSALHEADKGNYSDLIEFSRS